MEDITLFPPSSLLSFCVCRCVHTMACLWRSENNLESWFSHSALFEAGSISAYTRSMNFWGFSCRHPPPPPHRTTDARAIVCLGNLNLGPHACAAIPPYPTLAFRSGMFCIGYLLFFKDKISLCSPISPQTCGDPPALTSQIRCVQQLQLLKQLMCLRKCLVLKCLP